MEPASEEPSQDATRRRKQTPDAPRRIPRAWLRGTRVQRFVFSGLITLLFIYCFPYFAQMRSANELPRIYLTMAIAEEGSFAIDSGVKRWGDTVDMSPHGGKMYSNKAPGSSMLAVPAYWCFKALRGWTGSKPSLAELTWAFRLVTGVIPTLLFLVLLWRFWRRFAPMPETRRFLIVSYALGTMAMTYSVLFFSHQLAAICIATSYILATWVCEEELDERMSWFIGLSAGCAPLVDYQAAFAGVPIAVFFLFYQVRARRFASIAYAVLGAIPPIALLLYYHAKAFGSPFRTGYAASKTFAHFHQQGFLGMDKLRWEAFSGSLFSLDNGLFIFCPILLLAIPGWVLMARRKQWAHFSVTLSVCLIYLLFISSIIFWRGGWQLGPRYITAMIPFAFVPIAVFANWAESRWQARSLVVGAALVGVAVYALSTPQFPHFPEKFLNPLHDLVFQLYLDGHAAFNAGYLVGLSGFASLVPYLLLLGIVCTWVVAPTFEKRRSALVGVAIALTVLMLYGLFPSGPNADAAYRWVVSVMP